jgi:hypothetical protein
VLIKGKTTYFSFGDFSISRMSATHQDCFDNCYIDIRIDSTCLNQSQDLAYPFCPQIGLPTLQIEWILGYHHLKFPKLTLGYSTLSRQTHPAWHRLTLAKGFALEKDLRRDITVTGIAPWLTSEMTEANNELGDTTTRPPWDKRANSWRTFFMYLPEHIFEGFEYIWLAFRGIKLGTSIGDLQLLRDTGNDVYHMAWELSHTAQESTSNWKNLVYFYRCLETQSEMEIPPSPEEYVSRPGGMKIEARSMRYKYDVKNDAEVLTGATFVINPGEMVAVVGYLFPLISLD